MQPLHIRRHLVAKRQHFLNLLHALMRPRRALEIHLTAQPLALTSSRRKQ